MKNRFPRRQELIVLIALSLLCTVIVRLSGRYDVGLALLGAPLFLVACLMGFRRRSIPTPAVEPVTAASGTNDPAN